MNDYNPASSGVVGVALDEVFLNSGLGQPFQMYDVDRVEVLRGPNPLGAEQAFAPGTIMYKEQVSGVSIKAQNDQIEGAKLPYCRLMNQRPPSAPRHLEEDFPDYPTKL